MTRNRRILFRAVSVACALLLAGLACELAFRAMEFVEKARTYHDGPGGRFLPDPRWGWKPSKGPFRMGTSEFEQEGFINDHYMNEDLLDPERDAASTRILVLGDSHTYAAGVSTSEAWPHALVRLLEQAHPAHTFRTYNTALPNYNLHQYLLRLIDQGPLVQPDYVVVGLSYATDLYDLTPPSLGGWYGGTQYARDYFESDDSGQLVLRHWDPANADRRSEDGTGWARRARQGLSHFAVFRYLRRSKLALFIGSHLRPGGQSLWPNMERVVEREVSPEHQEVWRLFQKLLLRMRDESQRLGAEFVVVGIPYLPQVYDEIWQATFAGREDSSRTAANERVAEWCRNNGIRYIETLEDLRQRSRELGRWMHHRRDAHPNAEGHEVIARAIAREAGIVARR